MAFGGFQQGQGGTAPVSEINMVPLIDVMLVLLVIFMITAPLLTHNVKIDLPKAGSQPTPEDPQPPISLSIDAAGQFFWNEEVIDRLALRARLAEAAQRQPQPELQLRADKNTAYQTIAEVLADSSGAGMTRIGFVSDPHETVP